MHNIVEHKHVLIQHHISKWDKALPLTSQNVSRAGKGLTVAWCMVPRHVVPGWCCVAVRGSVHGDVCGLTVA